MFRDAAARARAADVPAFARAVGHSSLTTLIPALIAVIGLVTAFDLGDLRAAWSTPRRRSRPGPPAASSPTPSRARGRPPASSPWWGPRGDAGRRDGRDGDPRARGEPDPRRRGGTAGPDALRPRVPPGGDRRGDVDRGPGVDRGRWLRRRSGRGRRRGQLGTVVDPPVACRRGARGRCDDGDLPGRAEPATARLLVAPLRHRGGRRRVDRGDAPPRPVLRARDGARRLVRAAPGHHRAARVGVRDGPRRPVRPVVRGAARSGASRRRGFGASNRPGRLSQGR